MNPSSPFPNQGEIIRYLAVAMDLKAGNKDFDDFVKHGDTDFKRREKLLDEVFYTRLEPSIGDKFAGGFRQAINRFLDKYILLVKEQSLDGVPRSVSLPVLASNFFAWHVTELLVELTPMLNGPKSLVCLIVPGYSALKAIAEWLEQNIPDWHDSFSKWTKEQKDRYKAWCKGDGLPSFTNIQLIVDWLKKGGVTLAECDNQRIRCLILLARMFEFIKKSELGEFAIECMSEFMWAEAPRPNHTWELSLVQYEHNEKYEDLKELALALHDALSLRREKSADAKEETRVKLDELRKRQIELDPDGHTDYYINWLEARWYLLSGEIKESLVYFKKAFDQCLYTAGENQQGIIEQSLVVAAVVGDKPFLKRLKNQAIVFGWFTPPSSEDDSKLNNRRSRSRTNIVEDWEVEALKRNFCNLMPNQALFYGCTIVEATRDDEACSFTDLAEIQPDYRHPNRQITVKNLRDIKRPQLVWFAEMERLDVVKKLLDKGALVNVHSDAGDTPLLMAVQALNVTNMPFSSLNDECFKLISDIPHQAKIVNMRTTKRKLLPLICSVYSGNPKIVRKLLDMGADVDRRGEVHEQTALNAVIGLIGKRADTSYCKRELMRHLANPNEAELEGMRRYFAGLTGFTLQHQSTALGNMSAHDEFRRILELVAKLYVERIEEQLSLRQLREVANILLDAGADPHAEHFSMIHGYTPLMLSVEFDEVELFEKMLDCGGSPYKTYVCPRSKRNIDCWDIAQHFGAVKILSFLQERYPSR